MSSKRRVRRKQCTGKVKHGTEADAFSAAKKLWRQNNGLIRPYKCKFCGGWHNGHMTRRARQGMAARRERR